MQKITGFLRLLSGVVLFAAAVGLVLIEESRLAGIEELVKMEILWRFLGNSGA